MVTIEATPEPADVTIVASSLRVSTVLMFEPRRRVFVAAAAALAMIWFVLMLAFWIDGGRSRREFEKLLASRCIAASASTDVPHSNL